MPERCIFGIAFPSLDLESGLNDIARRREVCCGHASNGACGKELDYTQFFIWAFTKKVAFEVIVGWEIDAGEWHVSQQARTCTFVQTNKTQVLYNPYRRPSRNTLDCFGDFSLYLQPDFDYFERVCKDLGPNQPIFLEKRGDRHTTWQAPAEAPATISCGHHMAPDSGLL